MDDLVSSKAFEFAIGAMFVAFHAYGRYNTPESNRSSTTRLRFVACYMLYATTLLAIYWIVTVVAWVSPEILEKIMTLLGSGSASDVEGRDLFRSPITTALIFTALLPNFPMLKKGDQRLLQVFWDLAEIPGHAVKLAHRMYRAPYHIFPNKYSEIEREARAFDIRFGHEGFGDHRSPAFAWATACSLLMELKNWHSAEDQRYQRFILSRESDYEALKMQFATLSARLAAYYRRVDEMGGKLQKIEQDLRETLVSDGRDLFMKLCRLMAHAVLNAETGLHARHRAIEGFGFELLDDDRENLSASQLLKLIALVMLAFMGLSLIKYAAEGGVNGSIIGEVIFLGFLMGANYGVSAFIGIYPKDHWRFADIEATHHRPWLGYAVSGALAVAASLLIISALRFTRYTFDGLGYDGAFDQLLVALSWSYPHLYISFAVGFGVALACDIEWRQKAAHRRRIADAAMMAGIMVVAGYIAYGSMHGFFPFEGTKAPQWQDKSLASLWHFLAKSLVAGLLIGALVPYWFHTSRYRSPTQRITRFIDRFHHDLRIEAGKMERGELRQALVVIAAATAMADGLLDDTERDVFRGALGKLAEHNILDFQIETGMEDMLHLIDVWREDDTGDVPEEAMKGLDPLRRKDKLGELAIKLTVAIGYADGLFQEPEQCMLEKIVTALGRNVEKELSACGLSPHRPVAETPA